MTAEQTDTKEPVGGFISDPTEIAGTLATGCCGEPADSTGVVPGGQSGCCGEPANDTACAC